jgi:hypothetical protein
VVFTLAPEAGEGFFTIDRFHAPAFEVVVAAVEGFAYLGQLLQISRHGIFDEIIRGTASFGSQLLQTRFGFWPEIYLHKTSLESGASRVKKNGTIVPPASPTYCPALTPSQPLVLIPLFVVSRRV